ncbi:heme peroxidase [Cristinia sonorae]|uniref:Peroxidase n=1 Tax=Cristinia sonorae TaxID=1940300 RepID=A0A8K0XK81_9AGAR|nr:heme peroxidase [Cristinia sonorae]
MRPPNSKANFGRTCFIALLAGHSLVQAATWPNHLIDELDANLYDRRGYKLRSLPAGMSPRCTRFAGNIPGGRTNAADWIRAAFHDMATYNIADGTGGLDASIRFPEEQNRPENTGDGFMNTIIFISPSSNRYFSLADTIAMAMVTAVEMCGGPKIPYRGGRIDALQPNSPGVPEPQQSIEEHIASFARQGFTKADMIGLTACGHSIGGVQNIAFPDIVPPSSDQSNPQGNVNFDSTGVLFDNKIATEYLDGTTQNPLVVGRNSTTNSDFRIFNSDNNVTMSKYPAVFRSKCAELLARMVDTVPKEVTLTDVIQPILFKPVGVQLIWVGGGNLALTGEVRVWNALPSRVTVKWKARDGRSDPAFSAVLKHDTSHTSDPLMPDSTITNRWLDFPSILISSTQSLSSLSFEVLNADGTTKVEDLGGAGYPLQDVIMVANTTCMSPTDVKVRFAIRADIQPIRVYAKTDMFDETRRPTVVTTEVAPPSNPTIVAGYTLWEVALMSASHLTLAVDTGGKTYETPFIGNGSPLGPSLPKCP